PTGVWPVSPTAITYSGPYFQQIGGPQVGTISFSINGNIGYPNVQLVSVTLNTQSVLEGGTAIATVTLSGPAPVGGAQVQLGSDTIWPIANIPTPDIAHVPTSVIVPSGQTSTTFQVNAGSVLFPL